MYCLLCAVCAFSFVACVDQSFDLNNVSKEVTVGSGTTVVPLGYIENKTISDLLGGQDIEGLEKDADGNLSFNYSSSKETISIDDISTEFKIPAIASSFTVDYPQFDLDMASIEIEESSSLSVAGLEDFVDLSFGNKGYYIPEGIALPRVSGAYSKVFDGSDLNIAFDVPEQIGSIRKIYFADIEAGHNGAPVRLSINLNDLADVNGGGKFNYSLNFSGGKFKVLDADNTVVCNGNSCSGVVELDPGVKSTELVLYVESLENTSSLGADHRFDVPFAVSFDMGFELNIKSGYFSLNNLPDVEFSMDLGFKDAEVTINGDTTILDYTVTEGDVISVKGLPKEVKMINRIALKQDEKAVVSVYARGFSWLDEDITENFEVAVKLPEFLNLRSIPGEGYELNEATGEFRASIAALDRGVEVAVESLDFGVDGIVPDENGVVELAFTPEIVARIVDDATFNVSSLMHDGDLNVSIGIKESLFCIESLSGKVDYVYEVDQQFKLTGLDKINVEIGGLGIKPVIEVNIEHPLTMPVSLSGSVTPCANGVVNEQNKVTFENVNIKAATYANGEVVPAKINLVIADESLRGQYSDPKYTFVACDVTKLLVGTLPDTFDINLKLGVDSSEIQTLYVTDDISISYAYKVNVPLSIDDSFEINYKGQVTDLNDVFETVAGYDIEVGDITLIATVANSTPLELAADVTLVDVNGDPTAVQVLMDDDTKICGSSDGVTAAESVVRLTLDLGADGKLSRVSEVDGVSLELTASSAANDTAVSLNNNQYVGVKLQLELAGGVTVDLDKLMQQ